MTVHLSLDEYRKLVKPEITARLPGRMNKTEAAYAMHLEMLKAARQIVWYGFEEMKLRLADNTWYTPDFVVKTEEGEWEFREVKGFMRDDAAVKIKVAAEKFPARFLLIKKLRGGGWETRDI